MNLTIDELNKIFNLIILHLKSLNISNIELKHDFYWEIDIDEQFDITKQPSIDAIGQISDDLDEIKKYLNEERQLDIFALERLVAILTLINYENLSLFAKEL